MIRTLGTTHLIVVSHPVPRPFHPYICARELKKQNGRGTGWLTTLLYNYKKTTQHRHRQQAFAGEVKSK